jgi:hypothetical protein
MKKLWILCVVLNYASGDVRYGIQTTNEKTCWQLGALINDSPDLPETYILSCWSRIEFLQRFPGVPILEDS